MDSTDQADIEAASEFATQTLVDMGLSERAPGHVFWHMNPDMLGGIRLQARARGGKIEMTPVAQVVWLPIERLVAVGKGMKYRPWSPMAITRSLIQISAPGSRPPRFTPGDFAEGASDLMMLAKTKVIPQIVEMADERALRDVFRAQARAKVGQALRLVAYQTWERGRVDLDQAFADLMAGQTEARGRARLRQFLDRLAQSQQTEAILATKSKGARPAKGPQGGKSDGTAGEKVGVK
ncbi:MAG: hypothetical protein ACRBCL_10180 [Maritimibacter sp.]